MCDMTTGSQRPPKELGIKSAYMQSQQRNATFITDSWKGKKIYSITGANDASYST